MSNFNERQIRILESIVIYSHYGQQRRFQSSNTVVFVYFQSLYPAQNVNKGNAGSKMDKKLYISWNVIFVYTIQHNEYVIITIAYLRCYNADKRSNRLVTNTPTTLKHYSRASHTLLSRTPKNQFRVPGGSPH